MLTRRSVYDLIDSRLEHTRSMFGIDEGGIKTPPLPSGLDEWINFIRCAYIGNFDQCGNKLDLIDSIVMIAALCLGALGTEAWQPICILADGAPTRRSVDGYVLMIDHYLRAAISSCAINIDAEARFELRKVAAVCVRCLEEHGQ